MGSLSFPQPVLPCGQSQPRSCTDVVGASQWPQRPGYTRLQEEKLSLWLGGTRKRGHCGPKHVGRIPVTSSSLPSLVDSAQRQMESLRSVQDFRGRNTSSWSEEPEEELGPSRTRKCWKISGKRRLRRKFNSIL